MGKNRNNRESDSNADVTESGEISGDVIQNDPPGDDKDLPKEEGKYEFVLNGKCDINHSGTVYTKGDVIPFTEAEAKNYMAYLDKREIK